MSVSTMHFPVEIMLNLEVINTYLKAHVINMNSKLMKLKYGTHLF